MRRFSASWPKACVTVSRYGVCLAWWCPLSGVHRCTLATAAVTWTVLPLAIIVASVVARITGCSLASFSVVIGLYRENAIAIESEANDSFGGNVYYVTMQITLPIAPDRVVTLVLDDAIAAIQTSR